MKRNAAIFIGLGVLLALFFCLDICSGSIWLWPFDTLSVMEHNILHAIRIPKAITAVLAGAALSVSGLIMQTLFRNPLAGPYTLGVSSGASLGVAFLTMCSATMVMMLPIAACIGATGVLLLVLAVSRRVTGNVSLLIVGMMFGSIAGALVSLLQNFANPDALKLFIVWTLGSLSSVSWADMRLLLPILLLGTLFVILAMKPLNGLLLGEDYARGLGIRPRDRSLSRRRNGFLRSYRLHRRSGSAYRPGDFSDLQPPHHHPCLCPHRRRAAADLRCVVFALCLSASDIDHQCLVRSADNYMDHSKKQINNVCTCTK